MKQEQFYKGRNSAVVFHKESLFLFNVCCKLFVKGVRLNGCCPTRVNASCQMWDCWKNQSLGEFKLPRLTASLMGTASFLLLPIPEASWGHCKNQELKEPFGSSFAHLVGCFSKGLRNTSVLATPPSN